jgi:hypothetical protein
MLSQRSSVSGRRHANGPPERAREARFRGKLAIKRNLAQRRASRRDHDFRAFQPTLTEIAMRGHARGGGKCPGEMKNAQARDIGELGDGDVFSEMLFDVREDTSYLAPNKTIADVREEIDSGKLDFLRDFSNAAREELSALEG